MLLRHPLSSVGVYPTLVLIGDGELLFLLVPSCIVLVSVFLGEIFFLTSHIDIIPNCTLLFGDFVGCVLLGRIS